MNGQRVTGSGHLEYRTSGLNNEDTAMKNINAIKIIVRLEKNPYTGEMQEVLFLPDCPANYGMIAYCDPKEGHGEAPLEYYQSTKTYKGDAGDMWVNWYANYGGKYAPVRAVKRLRYADLHKAWGLAA